jgi:hypothetical protein
MAKNPTARQLEIALMVDLIARDNARDSEGFYAAGGFDTEEGVEFVLASAMCIVDSMTSPKEWVNYDLKAPLPSVHRARRPRAGQQLVWPLKERKVEP